MWRGIAVHTVSAGLQKGAQKSQRRALAIGTGNMHYGGQVFFGVPQACQQAVHAAQ